MVLQWKTPFLAAGHSQGWSGSCCLGRGVHFTEHSPTSIIRRRYTPRGIMITISEIQESVLRLSSVEREHLALLV